MRIAARILLVLYGLFLMIGGGIGYAQTGSLPSIIAGGIGGALSLYACFLSLKRPRTGFLVGAVVAGANAGMMGFRYYNQGGANSIALAVAVVSTLMVVALVIALFGGMKKRR